MENWVKRMSSSSLTKEELGTLTKEFGKQKRKGEIPWIKLVKNLVKKLAKSGSRVLQHNISKVIRSQIHLPVKVERELPKKEAAQLLEAYSSLITYINHTLEESDLSVLEISRLTSVILPAVIDVKVLSVRNEKGEVAQTIYNKITLLLGQSSELMVDALLHCRTLIFTKLRDPEIFIPIIRLFFTSLKRNKYELHSVSPKLYLKYLVLGKFWLFMLPREEVSSVRTYIHSLLKMPPSFKEWSSQANISWLKLDTLNSKSILKAMVISTALQTIYHKKQKKQGSEEKKIKRKVEKHLENCGQTCSTSEEIGASIAQTVESLDKERNEKVDESVNSSRDNKVKKESKCKKDKRKTYDGIVDIVCKAPKEKKRKVSVAQTETVICKELEPENVQLAENIDLLENENKELKKGGALKNDNKEAKVKLKKKKKTKEVESLCPNETNEESRVGDDEKILKVNIECETTLQEGSFEAETPALKEGQLKLKNKKKAKDKDFLDAGQLNESFELENSSEVQSSLEAKQICEEIVEGKVKLKKKKKAKNKESLGAGQVNESSEVEKSSEVQIPLEAKQICEQMVEGKVKLKKKKVKHRISVSEENNVDENDIGNGKDLNDASEVGGTTLKEGSATAESLEIYAIREVQLDLTDGKHVNVLGGEKVQLKKKKTKRKKSLSTEMSNESKVSTVEENAKDNDIATGGSFANKLIEPKENWEMEINSVETKMCEFGDEVSKEKVRLKKKKIKKHEKVNVVGDKKSLNDEVMSEVTVVESEYAQKSGMLYTCLKAKLESDSAKKMDQEVKLKKKIKGNGKDNLKSERTIENKRSDNAKHMSGTCESQSVSVSKVSNKVDVTQLDPEAQQGSEIDEGSEGETALYQKKKRKRKKKKKTKQQTSTCPEEKNEAEPTPEISSQTRENRIKSDVSADTPDSRKNFKENLSECEGQVTQVSHSHQKKKKEIEYSAEESAVSSGNSDKQKKKRRISAVTEGTNIECRAESLEDESLPFDEKDAEDDRNLTPSAKKPKVDNDSLLELAEGDDIRKKKKFLKKMIHLMLNSSDQEIELKENILNTLTGKEDQIKSPSFVSGKHNKSKSEDQKHSGKKRRKLSKKGKSLSSCKDEASFSHERIPSDYRGWSSSPPQSLPCKERLRTSSWDFTVTKLNWDKPKPREVSPHLAKKSPKEIVQSKPIQEIKCIERSSQQIETSPKVKTSLAEAEDKDSDLDIIYHRIDAAGDGVSSSSDDRDEAYGSPGDIVPCDEVNKMFTDEEILQYHQKCMKDNLQLRTGNFSKRKSRMFAGKEVSQLSIPEQEDIKSDSEEGIKAILKTIVRDTGRKSSIEGLEEEFAISSSSSSDAVILEDGGQERHGLKEPLKEDVKQEKSVLKDHGRGVNSGRDKIFGMGSKEVLSPGIFSKDQLTEKSVARNNATSQEEPLEPKIDTGCKDMQQIVPGYKTPQNESMNDTLSMNNNDDGLSIELGENPSMVNGLRESGYPSNCFIDLETDNASNGESSKADSDVPDVSCIENHDDSSSTSSKVDASVVDDICISGKLYRDTSKKESLVSVLTEKSTVLKEPNYDVESSLQDSPEHSEQREPENDISNDLLGSPKISKKEEIVTYVETTLQSSKLKELDINVESNLQDSLLDKNKVTELYVDEEKTLQELPKKREVIERNLKDSLENHEQKEQDMDDEITLKELPKNIELKKMDSHAEKDLQNESMNIFTLEKDANDVQSKQSETFCQLNNDCTNKNELQIERDLDSIESVDYMNSHVNDTHTAVDDSLEKIDLERSHVAELNLQGNTNLQSQSAGTSLGDVNSLPLVEKHKKVSPIVEEKETGLERQSDTNSVVSIAPSSPNEVGVVPLQDNLECDEYNPKNTSASEENQDSLDKLSTSYENILCNDGDEAYEASSDASEEPTPVNRRKTRSQRKSYPLILKAGEASDSDFSPLRRSQRSLTLKENKKAASTDSEVAVSETSHTTAEKGCSSSKSDEVTQHHKVVPECDARFPMKKIERKRGRKSYSSSKECEADAMLVKKRKMTKQCISDSEVGNYLVEKGFLDKLRSKSTRKNKLSSSVGKEEILLSRNSPGDKVPADASPFKRKGLKVQRSLAGALSEGCLKNEEDASNKVTASLIANDMRMDVTTPEDTARQSGPCSQLSDRNLKSTLPEFDVDGVEQKGSKSAKNFDDEQVFLENREEEDFSFRELLEEEEGDEIEVLSTSGLADSEDGLEYNVTTVIDKRTTENYKTSGKSASVSKKWQRKSSKQSPLGKNTETFIFSDKDLDKLEIPQLSAQRVSEAVLTKEILISPDVSDGECELVLQLDSGESEMKKNVSSSEGLGDLLEKLPEESKIVISTRGRRGGIRSPQKVIPEEQDESSLSQKKSKPNKIISSDKVPKYSRKSLNEDSSKQSSKNTPKRSYRRLSLGTPVKRNLIKNTSCNKSSKENVAQEGESTDAETSETRVKHFASKRTKLGNIHSIKDVGSSLTRVTRSVGRKTETSCIVSPSKKKQGNLSAENVSDCRKTETSSIVSPSKKKQGNLSAVNVSDCRKTETSCIVSPSKKKQGNLSAENVSDCSDKGGRSNVKKDFSPRKLRSRGGNKKDDVQPVTPIKRKYNRRLKKEVTAESNGSDDSEEKNYSGCKKISPQKNDSHLERTGVREIVSISENRDADTVKTGKAAMPVKMDVLVDPEETDKAGIERKESVNTKNNGDSEKTLCFGEEVSASLGKSKIRSKDVIEELTEPRRPSYKSARLSLGKRRTRLSLAKEGLGNVHEDILQTSDTQTSSLRETPHEEIQFQGSLSSSSSSDGPASSSLRELPQESVPVQLKVSSPSPKGAQLKVTATEKSTPVKDSCPPSSPVKVSSPSPTKTVKEILLSRALTKLPKIKSPEQPIGRRTRRASLMKYSEAKSSGGSS